MRPGSTTAAAVGQKFCHACGRILSRTANTKPTTARKGTTAAAAATAGGDGAGDGAGADGGAAPVAGKSSPSGEQKYCSHACRGTNRPGPIDFAIEDVFLALLSPSSSPSLSSSSSSSSTHNVVSNGVAGKGKTGARRVDRKWGVRCSFVQSHFFGPDSRHRMHDEHEHEHDKDGEETGKDPQKDGMRRAEERERVRRAGRRLVAFKDRENVVSRIGARLECVQDGRVVEGSFAKGDWGVRVVE